MTSTPGGPRRRVRGLSYELKAGRRPLTEFVQDYASKADVDRAILYEARRSSCIRRRST